jgi:O-antigen ligase
MTWALPKRHQLAAFIGTPLVLIFGLYLGSSQVQGRLVKIALESQSYAQQANTDSSSGWRINAWSRSVQAIAESPWYGHGVGSWAIAVKRLQGTSGTKTFGAGNASNPHQEYLLWGVEMGVLGTFLFLLLILSIVHDARRFPKPIQRAIASVVAAMAVACLFNSALYDDLLGDYFCITLGLLMALGIKSSSSAASLYQENLA